MSNFILPIIVLFVVFYGFKKVDIYDSFVASFGKILSVSVERDENKNCTASN